MCIFRCVDFALHAFGRIFCLIHVRQCEALPICAGRTFVSLYPVQFSKLDQLVKNCSEWVASCDNEYFEKQELNSLVKDFESFYRKSIAAKRSAVAQQDEVQIHRQCVVRLSKRFNVLQVVHALCLIYFLFYLHSSGPISSFPDFAATLTCSF